jgi:hemerythrin
MRLELTDDLLTGHPIIDSQHRELFDRVNLLQLKSRIVPDAAEFLEALDFMEAYLPLHFGAEEKLMVAYSVPSSGSHKQEHAYFRKQLAEIRALTMEHGPTTELRLRIYMLMSDALVRHIKDADRRLAGHVQSIEEK